MNPTTRPQFVESEELFRLSFRIRTQFLGPAHPETNRSRYEFAEMSRVLDRVEEAELFYLDALDAETSVHGAETEFGARIRNNLGDLYVSLGRQDEARKLLGEAMEIRGRLHGPDSERAWRSRLSLAKLESDWGDAGKAISRRFLAMT